MSKKKLSKADLAILKKFEGSEFHQLSSITGGNRTNSTSKYTREIKDDPDPSQKETDDQWG